MPAPTHPSGLEGELTEAEIRLADPEQDKPEDESESPQDPNAERECQCGQRFRPAWFLWRTSKKEHWMPVLFCPTCQARNADALTRRDPLYNKNLRVRWSQGRQGELIFKTMGERIEHLPEEKEHAPFSPSSLKEILVCGGWRNDPNGDPTLADRGTMGHLAVEKRDLSVIPEGPEWDRYRDAAQMCIEQQLRFEASLPKGWVEHRELRVDVLDQWGHIDSVYLFNDQTEAAMHDFKFAWNFYPADNPQFWGYCVGLWNRFPMLNKITVRVFHPFRNEIDEEEWTREAHYTEIEGRVLALIERARRNDPAEYQYNDACRYCGQRGTCPVVRGIAEKIAVRYEDPETLIPEPIHGSEITDPNVMARARGLADVMEKWVEGVKAAALQMRLAGENLPGWDLRHKKAARKLLNPQAAWDLLKDKVSMDEFVATGKFSITELEDLVAAKTPRGQKGQAKQAFSDTLMDQGALTQEGESVYLARKKK